jgi:hypothetical protein
MPAKGETTMKTTVKAKAVKAATKLADGINAVSLQEASRKGIIAEIEHEKKQLNNAHSDLGQSLCMYRILTLAQELDQKNTIKSVSEQIIEQTGYSQRTCYNRLNETKTIIDTFGLDMLKAKIGTKYANRLDVLKLAASVWNPKDAKKISAILEKSPTLAETDLTAMAVANGKPAKGKRGGKRERGVKTTGPKSDNLLSQLKEEEIEKIKEEMADDIRSEIENNFTTLTEKVKIDLIKNKSHTIEHNGFLLELKLEGQWLCINLERDSENFADYDQKKTKAAA